MSCDEAKQLRLILEKISELACSATQTSETTSREITQIACQPKSLPKDLAVQAAKKAIEINIHNHPPRQLLRAAAPKFPLHEEHIAIITSKRWHTKGVDLSVGFLDSPHKDLIDKILFHMNAWGKTANVNFRYTQETESAQVRIAREQNKGYWSYIGTDILLVDTKKQTMNLDGFTMETPESEFKRVVRHETGHTLGFPHEHMRRDLVEKIKVDDAVEYYKSTQGWSRKQTMAQVLTPIEESSLMGTPMADGESIMCYHVSGSLTKDGNPILGGLDISETDREYAALFYPKPKLSTPNC